MWLSFLNGRKLGAFDFKVHIIDIDLLRRLPRMHPTVREYLSKLIKCIELMPFSGPLFTAQAPFFPIFIMALVTVTPEDRRVATGWFETVVSGAGDRSVSSHRPLLVFAYLPLTSAAECSSYLELFERNLGIYR